MNIVLSTPMPEIFYYQGLILNFLYSGLWFFLAIPPAIILFNFRENPSQYGFQAGDWMKGIAYLAVSCVLSAIILWFAVELPGMAAYYAPQAKCILPNSFINATRLLGWEFFL